LPFRILHTSGFQQEEYLLQQFIIDVNILQSAIALIKAMNTFSLKFGSSKRMVCQLCWLCHEIHRPSVFQIGGLNHDIEYGEEFRRQQQQESAYDNGDLERSKEALG